MSLACAMYPHKKSNTKGKMSEDKPIDASSVVSPKNDVTLEIDVPVLDLLANVANTKEKIPLRTVVCNDVPMRFPEKVYIYIYLFVCL